MKASFIYTLRILISFIGFTSLIFVFGEILGLKFGPILHAFVKFLPLYLISIFILSYFFKNDEQHFQQRIKKAVHYIGLSIVTIKALISVDLFTNDERTLEISRFYTVASILQLVIFSLATSYTKTPSPAEIESSFKEKFLNLYKYYAHTGAAVLTLFLTIATVAAIENIFLK